MDIMQMGKNPNYLGAWDLYDMPNQRLTAVIDHIADEDVMNGKGGTERATVCYFKSGIKPMILNLTNKKRIAKLYRTKDTDKLAGKVIEICFEKVKAFGMVTDALRIVQAVPRVNGQHTAYKCAQCGKEITPIQGVTAEQIAVSTKKNFGKCLCMACVRMAKAAAMKAEEERKRQEKAEETENIEEQKETENTEIGDNNDENNENQD